MTDPPPIATECPLAPGLALAGATVLTLSTSTLRPLPLSPISHPLRLPLLLPSPYLPSLMKLLKCSGDAFVLGKSDSGGEAKLLAEHEEDLWHAYNLIVVGDAVSASTLRKVQRETTTGSTTSERVKLTLRVRVKAVDFDPEAGELRLSGIVLGDARTNETPEGVRLGSAHTLQLETGRAFTVIKDVWDSVTLERLKEATGEGAASTAELAAVLLQPGLATICVVSNGMSIVKARVETHIPRRGNAVQLQAAEKATQKWRQQVLSAILKSVDLEKIKVLVVAGPGFTKDDFVRWVDEEVGRRGEEGRSLQKSRSKWVLMHANSAHKHALAEVLADPATLARVADIKAAAEVAALATFLTLMASQPDRVTYGYKHVVAALEQGAIDKMLLSDNLFRARTIARRKQYVGLVEAAKEAGAVVHIFSSLHVSGEQLALLGGIAAVLRFPLAIELDDEDSEEEEGGKE